jgi:UDP-glucose 4-epimerase
MKILVTGGTGYIGSHTCLALIDAGLEPVILDNLCNSKLSVLKRIEEVAGKAPIFYQGDVRDPVVLDRIFQEQKIAGVIHFAALKAVGESTQKPYEYFENNISGTLSLLGAMRRAGCYRFIFSSSATVYGDPHAVPITENFPRSTMSPYGQTKLMVEQILEDMQKADPRWSITLLRYFNPIGAHESGRMGEDPQGIPNNLMPYITQVAIGRRDCLNIFGRDYPTKDGTCVRDYIHVMDLAEGHVKAWQVCGEQAGLHIYNLGTGQGVSVLEMVHAFARASGLEINYKLVERRPGDVAECWADPAKAQRELGWNASRTIDDMTRDSWRWQQTNPNGYEE